MSSAALESEWPTKEALKWLWRKELETVTKSAA